MLHLTDGVPLKLFYSGGQSVSKFMIFPLHKVISPKKTLDSDETVVTVQVKSLTTSFQPSLYSRLYHNINEYMGGIDFPPAGISQNFDECHNWDYRL